MKSQLKLYHFPFKAMGTPCDIQLFAARYAQAKQVAELAIASGQFLKVADCLKKPRAQNNLPPLKKGGRGDLQTSLAIQYYTSYLDISLEVSA